MKIRVINTLEIEIFDFFIKQYILLESLKNALGTLVNNTLEIIVSLL